MPTKLDAAGAAKMKTLEEAMILLQRAHAQVENYAMAVKRGMPTGHYLQGIRRTLPSLGENLKAQFGLISDTVFSVNLAASRGASETVRIRVLREGIGHIKQALDIAVTQTKDRHTVKDGLTPPRGSDVTP